MQFPLRGANFRDPEAKFAAMEQVEGSVVTLEREPDNSYDTNAIRVITEAGIFIGYVAKEVAVELAPLLDAELIEPRAVCIKANGIYPEYDTDPESQ